MLSCFLDVDPHAEKILYKGDVHKFVLDECEFRENAVSEIRIVLKGHKLISMRTPHGHCPISVKFGVRDLHIIAVVLVLCVVRKVFVFS